MSCIVLKRLEFFLPNIASLAYGSANASMYNNPFELFVNTLFIRIAVPRIRDARALNGKKNVKKK